MSSRHVFLLNITTGLMVLGWIVQPSLGQTAATVNGEAISQAEVQKVLDLRPNTVPLPKNMQIELRRSALNLLIDDLLIRQFLQKNVTAPSLLEVEKEWDKLRETMSKEHKTMDDFLRESQQTPAQVRADIAVRLQWNEYLRTHITDAELRSYYQENKPFFDKTIVRASHILVKADSTVERQKARQKLEYIHQEIVTGKISFEDAARKYSDCPSKEKGGDVGQFPYKFIVVDPFAKAAFAMKENDISDVVVSEVGLHLIKVTHRIEGRPSRFEDVKETVREAYVQDQGIYNRVLTEQKRTAKIDIHS